jgi:hypothetical protein
MSAMGDMINDIILGVLPLLVDAMTFWFNNWFLLRSCVLCFPQCTEMGKILDDILWDNQCWLGQCAPPISLQAAKGSHLALIAILHNGHEIGLGWDGRLCHGSYALPFSLGSGIGMNLHWSGVGTMSGNSSKPSMYWVPEKLSTDAAGSGESDSIFPHCRYPLVDGDNAAMEEGATP